MPSFGAQRFQYGKRVQLSALFWWGLTHWEHYVNIPNAEVKSYAGDCPHASALADCASCEAR